MNFLGGTISEKIDLTFTSDKSELTFNFSSEQKSYLKEYIGQEVVIGIRPEDLSIEKTNIKSIELECVLDVIEPMGNETFIYFEIEKVQFIARVKPLYDIKVGGKIKLYIDPEKIYLFDKNYKIMWEKNYKSHGQDSSTKERYELFFLLHVTSYKYCLEHSECKIYVP